MRTALMVVAALGACTCEDRNEFETEDGRRYEAVIERSVGCNTNGATPIEGNDQTTIVPLDGRGGAVTLLVLPQGLAVCPAGTTSSWNAEEGRTVTSAPCSYVKCTEAEHCPRSYIFCTPEHRCR